MNEQQRVLTEAEFNALQERLLREAPPDLDDAQRGAWLREQLGQQLGVQLAPPPELPEQSAPPLSMGQAIATLLGAAFPGGNMPAAVAAAGDANPLVGAGQWAGRHPAAAGAMAGGLVAAPFTGGLSIPAALGASGAAGAGGAAAGLGLDKLLGGEATRDMTLPQAAKTIAVEGASTAAGEGVGRGLGTVARWGANKLMDAAAGGQRAIRQRFADVDVADVLNRFGINPTTGRGRLKADRLRNTAINERTAMTRAADAAGAPPIQPLDPAIFQGLAPARDRAATQARTAFNPSAPTGIDDRQLMMALQNPGGISMEDAIKLISELSEEGRAAYLAYTKGLAPHDLDAVTAKGLADGLRGVQRRRVPGVEGVNRRAQGLIEASQIADDLSRRPFQMGGHTARGLGIGGGGLAYGLTGDPWLTAAIGSLPWIAGSPTFLAPASIGLYQGARALPDIGRLIGALVGEMPTREPAAAPWDEEQ